MSDDAYTFPDGPAVTCQGIKPMPIIWDADGSVHPQEPESAYVIRREPVTRSCRVCGSGKPVIVINGQLACQGCVAMLLEKDTELSKRLVELEAAERKCAELAAALDTLRRTGECLRHWHDWGRDNEGVVISSRSFWEFHEALDETPDTSAILATYRAQVARETLERVYTCRPQYPDEDVPQSYVAEILEGQKDWAEAIEAEFAPKGESNETS